MVERHTVEGAGPERVVEIADRAAEVLEGGGVVVVPTDTVYGVAARLDRPDALGRLFRLKHRDRSKPIAVLVADAAQAATLVVADASFEAVAAAFWPGALTIVAPRRAGWVGDLGGDGTTVGVRAPGSPFMAELLARTGPIAATSANRSGSPTGADLDAALADLDPGEVELAVDGGHLGDVASTVVSIDGTSVRVLRAGAVGEQEVRAALAARS